MFSRHHLRQQGRSGDAGAMGRDGAGARTMTRQRARAFFITPGFHHFEHTVDKLKLLAHILAQRIKIAAAGGTGRLLARDLA